MVIITGSLVTLSNMTNRLSHHTCFPLLSSWKKDVCTRIFILLQTKVKELHLLSEVQEAVLLMIFI